MQNVSSDVRKMARNGMNKVEEAAENAKASYPELEEIQKDWRALKRDVAKFASHATSDGRRSISDFGSRTMESVEHQISEKPAQTLAIAFVAGALASILLGRR